VQIVLKSGNLNLLEPSGSVMGLLYLYHDFPILCASSLAADPG
jgi:hypothetical protein